MTEAPADPPGEDVPRYPLPVGRGDDDWHTRLLTVTSPTIRIRVNTEHYRFVPGTRQLVFVPTPTQGGP